MEKRKISIPKKKTGPSLTVVPLAGNHMQTRQSKTYQPRKGRGDIDSMQENKWITGN